LLDDVIIERYIDQHPSLRSVADVADGQYAIALRPADEDLRTAIDRTLEHSIASGEWPRTLQRWNLDNARQVSLVGARGSTTKKGGHTVGRSLTPGQVLLFLEGALVTLMISMAAMAIAAPLGMALTYVRLEYRFLGRVATIYVEVVRGTPVLLQLYVIYYGLSGVVAFGPWTAAILGLGLNYAAYESEIFRAGVASVPRSQWEAAMALGASRRVALRTVIARQAMRLALPGMTNDFISLLKDSSLVSVLTVVELTKRMTIVAVDSRGWVVPGVLCAALYFGLGYPFAFLARRLEKRLHRHPVM
jgi:polar amino acid transport system substrate-binding protein